jgi:hypothetical protein
VTSESGPAGVATSDTRTPTPLIPAGWIGERTAGLLSLGYFVVLLTVGLAFHRIGDYGVETDFYATHAPNAQQILAGKVVVNEFKGPGYDLVLAAIGGAMGDLFAAGILISCLSASLVLLLTHRTLARLFSVDAALVVSLALATNYNFLELSYTASTDMFFNLLAVSTVYILVRRDPLRPRELIAAGAIAGYAYLTRYNGVFLHGAFVVGVVLLGSKRLDWMRRAEALALFFSSSLLLVVPWGLYCLETRGNFFYNGNYLNVAYEMFGRGGVGWEAFWHQMGPHFGSYLDVVRYAPTVFLQRVAVNLIGHFWLDVSRLVGLPLGVFACAGILVLVVEKVDRKQATFFVFSLVCYLVLVPVFYLERFSLYLAPTILLLAVLFFQWRRLPALGLSRFRLTHAVLLAAVLVSAQSAVRRVAAGIDSGPAEVLMVRDAFHSRYGVPREGTRIVARKAHIAYYLGMEYLGFPYVGTADELIMRCRESGARYLFYSRIEAGMRPQFRFLLDPRNAPPGFKPVVWVAHPPAVLYELTQPALR